MSQKPTIPVPTRYKILSDTVGSAIFGGSCRSDSPHIQSNGFEYVGDTPPRVTRQKWQSPPSPVTIFFAFVLFSYLTLYFHSGSFAAESSQTGDAFITASIAEPSNLIPFFASDSASASVSKLIFNGLVKYDKDLHLVGDLAENWEVKEKGRVITFYLRRNVFWQDGMPFTADDVAFTFEKLKDPNTPTPYGGDFEKVQSLRVIDPYTVEVIYGEPFSPGLASWSMGIVPKHLLSKENLLSTRFSRHPIGTGPYILKRWKAGDQIDLEANHRYFEGRPFIDHVVYRIIPDETTTFLELATENLDMVGLTPLQFEKQTQTPFFQSHYQKFKFPSFSYTYVGYNLRNDLFADMRVRKAIGMAIHKREIIHVTLLGLGRVSTGPFLPDSWAYNASVPEISLDPAKAKTLLRQAGWTDTNGDGILDKGTRKFSFTLLTNVGNNERKMACEMIQRQLRDVGIEVNIQVLEWSTLLHEYIDKRRFEAVLLGWQLSQDPDIFDLFHSSKSGLGQFNFTGYQNPEVDQLLEEGRRIFPIDERAKIYHRVHEILSQEEPYTFLYVPDALPIVHRRFKGVEQGPAGIGHNFIRWYVPQSERKYNVKK